ncbi:kinase-like protein [Polychaeton citri CBS 116435]|uniref:mitogen-activated protein kinase kinase n=1 Tax=Polychaeton citri CBS 116435 TaxID=1314669 RepID=A0A9P4QK44_9PEZI|nr:kinase-like protein [Polychaeton citri CBS 116435]
MTSSSQPLGNLSAARGPPRGTPIAARGGAGMNPDIAARMKAFSISRGPGSRPPAQSTASNGGPSMPGPRGPPTPGAAGPITGIPSNFKLPPHLARPQAHMANSSPAISTSGGSGGKLSIAEKRGLRLPGGLPGGLPGQSPAGSPAPGAPGAPAGRQKPKMSLSQMGGGAPNGGQANGDQAQSKQQSAMDKYADMIDTKTGSITFKGKARVHGHGIEFTSGRSFDISLDEVDTLDELGKGNYGTVYKVRHSRPRFRKTGQGLAGNKARGPNAPAEDPSAVSPVSPTRVEAKQDGTTGIVMAMKEMRLELDDAKFQSIIMELDILHRCISPHIVDFYGAFFQEGAVYICMEFMDGGSCDKIYGDGVPENVLRKITLSTTLGLKSLKEEHNIIHRDVKPTNILVNTRGQIKICDFGVSGNLVASIAKTNIGCQSYMAPERISSGGMSAAGAVGPGTYSVQSDIWSLGLSIIECALGRYPYPPETYDNIFSQLAAIVDGDPPDLPADRFSEAAHDFVAGCLNKIPNLRPTYPMLLQHAWLAPLLKPDTISEEDEEAAEKAAERGDDIATGSIDVAGDNVFDKEVSDWVIEALERKRTGKLGTARKPALHAAPLDATAEATSPQVEKGKVVAVEG